MSLRLPAPRPPSNGISAQIKSAFLPVQRTLIPEMQAKKLTSLLRPCTALKRGFVLQITYKRPLRFTIWQSGWRCFALRSELSTCILTPLNANKMTKTFWKRAALPSLSKVLFPGIIRMRFRRDIEGHVRVHFPSNSISRSVLMVEPTLKNSLALVS